MLFAVRRSFADSSGLDVHPLAEFATMRTDVLLSNELTQSPVRFFQQLDARLILVALCHDSSFGGPPHQSSFTIDGYGTAPGFTRCKNTGSVSGI